LFGTHLEGIKSALPIAIPIACSLFEANTYQLQGANLLGTLFHKLSFIT